MRLMDTRVIRRGLGRIAGRLEALLLRTDALTPPLHLRWSYYRTLRRDGYVPFANAAARELIARGLQPHHRVLDVGCGLGPLALGLLSHLTSGSYEGFDVHAEAIAWCRRAISTRQPRFRFRHVDGRSTAYNPAGELSAAACHFPYED